MKTLQLLLLSLLVPMIFQGQQTLTGLWTGTLDNDSNTVRKDQTFEIALTQYKQKVYGYSRMNFVVNDTLYYIIKRVKGEIENGVCEVKDDHIVKHNFPRQPDKGVKLITTFRQSNQDSIWRLDGDWKTTETKKHRYYSISGNISLRSEPDLEKSKIFPHLEELDLANDVAFYKESKIQAAKQQQSQRDVAATKKKEQVQQPIVEPVFATNNTANTIVAAEHPEQTSGKQENSLKREDTVEETSLVSAGIKKSELPASTVSAGDKKNVSGNTTRPVVKQQDLPIKKEEPVTATLVETTTTSTKKSDIVTTVKTSGEKKFEPVNQPTVSVRVPSSTAAAFVSERKTVASQVVTFQADSLELALYDNGEVDGDTVSILVNGEIFMARQGLKASSIKRTVYIQPGQDEVTLILYAENLGKYPPNTGLLIVRDGEQKYQIRFSADLQQNASVVFRRKK